MDPFMQTLFDEVGISPSQLKDKETANFIYDFIDKRGGIEALKKEQENKPLPLILPTAQHAGKNL